MVIVVMIVIENSDNDTAHNGKKIHDYSICMGTQSCMTFVPSGHICTCKTCAYSVTECPICRYHIEKRIKSCVTND